MIKEISRTSGYLIRSSKSGRGNKAGKKEIYDRKVVRYEITNKKKV